MVIVLYILGTYLVLGFILALHSLVTVRRNPTGIREEPWVTGVAFALIVAAWPVLTVWWYFHLKHIQ